MNAHLSPATQADGSGTLQLRQRSAYRLDGKAEKIGDVAATHGQQDVRGVKASSGIALHEGKKEGGHAACCG